MMNIKDFDYSLPPERIALQPPQIRGASRLEVLDRRSGEITNRLYQNVVDYINPGDVVVLNNTKVIKARLLATKSSGVQIELLVLEDHNNTDPLARKVMYRGKLKTEDRLTIDNAVISITQVNKDGTANIKSTTDILELCSKYGTVPLPPYLHRDATKSDEERYQTVFSKQLGSVAAPTASLNFTQDIVDELTTKGAIICYLTLHVGLGTFLPIRTDDITEHTMHSEYFIVPEHTIEAIKTAKASNNKVVAVGTTVTRTLEYLSNNYPGVFSSRPSKVVTGEANIFIYPGYEFQAIDMMLTNFHAPKSTVLMMAAAFAGWDNLKHAYEEAIIQEYNFLSYGDSMLIV
jgi:S-adenosylmethionine:tRNA ribosyltransferase-isomerase